MKFQLFLLGSLVSAGTLGASVSLVDYVKVKAPVRLPTNCLKADQNNSCTSCTEGFEPVKGVCTKIDTTADDFEPSVNFVPCGKDASCGEAISFKTDQEFQDFVNKYNPPIN